jgi:cyanate permease
LEAHLNEAGHFAQPAAESNQELHRGSDGSAGAQGRATYVLAAIGPALAGLVGDQMGASAPVLLGAFLFLSVVPLVMLFRTLHPKL